MWRSAIVCASGLLLLSLLLGSYVCSQCSRMPCVVYIAFSSSFSFCFWPMPLLGGEYSIRSSVSNAVLSEVGFARISSVRVTISMVLSKPLHLLHFVYWSLALPGSFFVRLAIRQCGCRHLVCFWFVVVFSWGLAGVDWDWSLCIGVQGKHIGGSSRSSWLSRGSSLNCVCRSLKYLLMRSLVILAVMSVLVNAMLLIFFQSPFMWALTFAFSSFASSSSSFIDFVASYVYSATVDFNFVGSVPRYMVSMALAVGTIGLPSGAAPTRPSSWLHSSRNTSCSVSSSPRSRSS